MSLKVRQCLKKNRHPRVADMNDIVIKCNIAVAAEKLHVLCTILTLFTLFLQAWFDSI